MSRERLKKCPWHDGSILRLRKLSADYNPTDRVGALSYVQRSQEEGDTVTGLLYVDPQPSDCHEILDTADVPLNQLDESVLCPGSRAAGPG